jgi:hypothetical protein
MVFERFRQGQDSTGRTGPGQRELSRRQVLFEAIVDFKERVSRAAKSGEEG